MTALYYIAIILFLLTCFILCVSILIQESKSSGLGASFGGDTGDSLFGTSTPEVLKKFTAYLSVVFMIGCIILSLWTGAMGRTKTTSPQSEEVIER